MMQRWRRLLIPATMATIATGLVWTAPAFADTIHWAEWYPFETVVTSPCPGGEDVLLSGSVHDLQTITDNGTVIHSSFHENTEWTGVGLTSGDSYLLRSATNEHWVARDGLKLTGTAHFEFIGAGDTYLFSEVGQFTVDDNGNVTFTFSRENEVCH